MRKNFECQSGVSVILQNPLPSLRRPPAPRTYHWRFLRCWQQCRDLPVSAGSSGMPLLRQKRKKVEIHCVTILTCLCHLHIQTFQSSNNVKLDCWKKKTSCKNCKKKEPKWFTWLINSKHFASGIRTRDSVSLVAKRQNASLSIH